MCVIPELRGLRQEDRKFKVILGYIASLRLAWNAETFSKSQNKIFASHYHCEFSHKDVILGLGMLPGR